MPTIPAPLITVIHACAKPDAPADAGLSAHDLSPLHIASLLLAQKAHAASLRAAVDELRKTSGTASGRTDAILFPEINATLTPAEVDRLCRELEENVEWAVTHQGTDHVRRYPHVNRVREYANPEIKPSLVWLLHTCETICVAACCGMDAFNFSPIHIASHLIRWSGVVEEKDVAELRAAIVHWRQSAGASAGHTAKINYQVIETTLTPHQVDDLCAQLETNLDTAVQLVGTLAPVRLRDR